MTVAVLDRPVAFGPAAVTAPVKNSAVLVDMTRCIGCKACVVSCKEWNDLSYAVPEFDPTLSTPPLSGTAYTALSFHETVNAEGGVDWTFAKRQCMHCSDPSCVSVCPVQALKKTDEGAIVYNSDQCMGCRYCQLACPFSVPKFEWNEVNPEIRKCDFCADRLQAGLTPRCAGACPTAAIQFGERDALLLEARERMADQPAKYVNHIYGETENGGTAWMYLSSLPFEDLGFPEVPAENSVTASERSMAAVPGVAAAAAIVFGGLAWFTKRKRTVQSAASRERAFPAVDQPKEKGSDA